MMQNYNMPTYLGGAEKLFVREHGWYKFLKVRKDKANRRIKYLTLPGKWLTEIKDCVQRGIIEGPNDLIVVEDDLLDYYEMVRKVPILPYRYKLEPFTALNQNINQLFQSGTLSTLLPLDAVNLDYCGFMWGGDALSTEKWTAIRRLVELQARSSDGRPHPFTLFECVS